MTSSPPLSGLQKEITHPLVLDGLIVLGLLLVAWLGYFATPQLAANLSQDGIDFAMPAVNLLERGRLVMTAYGHDFPSSHPLGTSLLLLPSYVIFGHFLGNGIYSLFLCAFGSIVLTYFIGVKLGGRLCGSVAALFLITHYGFWQYSQKIMSEMPSVFLATALLALLLTIRERKRPGLTCLLAGAVLGFAIMVRSDNLLLIVPAAWLLWENTWRVRLRQVGLCLVGMLPFLAGLAVYDQATFGSPWLTGYQYWGNAGSSGQPLFSTAYATKSGFIRLRGIDSQFAWLIDGNAAFYSKSLLGEADTSRVFGDPNYWQLSGRRLYQTLALLRTALGLIGLLACLIGWRTHPLRRKLLLWLIISTVMYVFFYLGFSWQEERFLLRLVPAFCLANAMGVSALLFLWPARVVRLAVVTLVGALILALGVFNMQMGFPTGGDSYLYESLSLASQRMEPNAVVVSNFDPLRVDPYLIRGTARIAVPLERSRAITVNVGRDLTPTTVCPFVAAEHPERLREFLHTGGRCTGSSIIRGPDSQRLNSTPCVSRSTCKRWQPPIRTVLGNIRFLERSRNCRRLTDPSVSLG